MMAYLTIYVLIDPKFALKYIHTFRVKIQQGQETNLLLMPNTKIISNIKKLICECLLSKSYPEPI